MKKFSKLLYKTQLLIVVPSFMLTGIVLGIGLALGSVRYYEKKYQNNKSGTQFARSPLSQNGADSLQATYKYDDFMYKFQTQKAR